jgi:hypothetical protein
MADLRFNLNDYEKQIVYSKKNFKRQQISLPSNKNAPQTKKVYKGIFHLRAVGGGVEPPRSN